jgi:ArsR family transcriptional regulator
MIRNNKTKNVSAPAGKRDVDKAMLFEMQADICQALANPKRLQVLDLLKGGELSVGEMMKAMGIQKANLSQHLAVMRQKGIVSARREGTTVYYRLARPRITEACAVMREVLMDGFRDQERLARRVREGLGRKKP